MNLSESKIPFTPLITAGWEDYQFLDSGEGMKLERYGNFILARPEAEAVWSKNLSENEWSKADAKFVPSSEEMGGHWVKRTSIPSQWIIKNRNLRSVLKLSSSRHIGMFPDQSTEWEIIHNICNKSKQSCNVINLFGYTGLASLSAASAGARVTHVDASPKAIAWAKENQVSSALGDKPIRWIVDDAVKYLQREVRRGVKYDVIILDPPKFGRGPKGEVWEFYKLLPDLLTLCSQILSKDPKLIVLTAYAVKASSVTLATVLQELMSGTSGQIQSGELFLQESTSSRCLSTAVYAEWCASSLI